MPKIGRTDALPGFNVALERKGLRKDFLAKRLGLTTSALWKTVSGFQKRIDPVLLRNIAKELDCTVDELLNPPAE